MITGKYLSDSWKEDRDRVILNWLGGNKDAFDLLFILNDASEMWDDLIDKDKEVKEDMIHHVFTELIMKLPNNPFFIQHRAYLVPLLFSAIVSWRTANVLEKGSRSERALSYTLRSVDLQILLGMIHIIKGHAAAIALSPEIWRTFVSRNDSIDEYLDTYIDKG